MNAHAVFAGLVILPLIVPAAGAWAQTEDEPDSPARAVPRYRLSQADYSIVTRRGDVALLVRRDSLALQLTDDGLDRLLERVEEGESGEEPRTLLAQVLRGALRGGAAALLDHAVLYPVTEIERAAYEDGRLILEGRDGDELFDIEVDGRDIMEDFSAGDARGLVRRLQVRRIDLRD